MSKGPGKIERVIAEMVRNPAPGWLLWVGVVTIAREVRHRQTDKRRVMLTVPRASMVTR